MLVSLKENTCLARPSSSTIIVESVFNSTTPYKFNVFATNLRLSFTNFKIELLETVTLS